MQLLIMAFLFGSTLVSNAQEIFLSERGSYTYSAKDIAKKFENHDLSYLKFNSDYLTSNAKYKLNKRGEFQIKDWFKQDWFALQDLFILDEEIYRHQFKGHSFLESKQKAYEKWTLSEKTNLHKKSHPIMKEWGGLNHPPLKKLQFPLSFYAQEQGTSPETELSHFYDPKFQLKLDELSKSELSFNNKLTLLKDRESFQEKLRLIKSSKESILMSSLVFVCDKGTREITEALIRRKLAGVDVRILTDATVAKYLKHRECLEFMQDQGIEVIQGDDFWKYNGRAIYHSKMLVVDLKVGIVGGHNMIDADNLSRGVDFKNRDVDLKIEGPMVTDIAQGFLTDWEHFFNSKKRDGITSAEKIQQRVRSQREQETDQFQRGSSLYQHLLSGPGRSKGVCRFIRQSPYEDVHRIGKVYLEMLKATRRYLALTNPVFSDTKVTPSGRLELSPLEWRDKFFMYNQLFTQLQVMAKRGMKMDFVTSNVDMSGNENVVIFNEAISRQQEENRDWASNLNLFKIHLSNAYYGIPHYRNMLTDWVPYNNVHLWTHISFMHSKVVHFDRISASVGSYNIQHNATDHAYEVTTLCQDDHLNQQLDQMFVEDMVNSIPLVFK